MLQAEDMRLSTLVLLALTALPAAWAEGQGVPRPARHPAFADAEARYSHPPDDTSTAPAGTLRGAQPPRTPPADPKADRRQPGMIGASRRWGRGVHAVPVVQHPSPTGMGMRI